MYSNNVQALVTWILERRYFETGKIDEKNYCYNLTALFVALLFLS